MFIMGYDEQSIFFYWPTNEREVTTMNRIPISVDGFKRLENELEELIKERPAIIQAIKEAREEGDLRENAGYDAARERQGMLEARINYIESRMIRFDVIDIDTLQSDRIVFGATVTLLDMDTDETKVYTLLGPDEADHTKGTISLNLLLVALCWANRRGMKFPCRCHAAEWTMKLFQ